MKVTVYRNSTTMYNYTVEVSAEGHENTNFNSYEVALEYFNKLKQQGMNPVLLDNLTNTVIK